MTTASSESVRTTSLDAPTQETGTPVQYRFGLDFAPVNEIPVDARDRLNYFQTFKEIIHREKDKIKTWHRAGGGGREVIQALTGLIDEVIRQIVNSLIKLEKYKDSPICEEFALIAVGGYGRGELNPYSDIDLLFVLQNKIDPLTDEFIQEMISIFWGIGMEIGQSCRTIKDCISLARDDLTVKTSMIETRFLTGNRDLAKNFTESITKNVLRKNVKEFLNSKLKEKYARIGLEEGMVRHPEPDIKNGPGGLRDYHVAMWAVAVRFGCLSFREIGRNDIITDAEVEQLYDSVDFSLRVRNELHYLTHKKTDLLSLNLQEQVATNLGYEPSENEDEEQPVERFMRDYFLNATNIHNFSEHLFDRCLKTRRSFRRAFAFLQRKDLGNGFFGQKNQLILVDDDVQGRFEKNPRLLLDVFNLCRLNDLDLDTELRRHLRRNKHLITEEFLNSAWAKDFFRTLLESPNAEKTLRLMHDVEILDQSIPEFGQARCSVNYDFYHRFTADEHALRMIRFFEKLGTSAEEDQADLVQMFNSTSITDKRVIKLACLLHSLGVHDHKGHVPPETRERLDAVAHRLGFEEEERVTLQFLIDQMYELMETAFHQDIRQPVVIQKYARRVGTLTRLNLLYLLSYAELRAVAPGTLTAWKKTQLVDLYGRVKSYLDRPETLKEKPRNTREQIGRILEDEFSQEEIDQHLEKMSKEYLVTTDAQEAARHIRLIRSLDDQLFALERDFNKKGGFHHLVLCCPTQVQAFMHMVGTLTAKNLNILGAQIYRRKDGLVLVSTQVADDRVIEAGGPEFWADLETQLKAIIEGSMDIEELLKSRPRFISHNHRNVPIIPRVEIDNGSSAYTLVRIEARDHMGMLYKISRVFERFNIKVHQAKITVQGDRGIDVFSVLHQGQKVKNKLILTNMKDALIQALLKNLE